MVSGVGANGVRRIFVSFGPPSYLVERSNPAIPLRKNADVSVESEWDSARPQETAVAFATSFFGEVNMDADRIVVRVRIVNPDGSSVDGPVWVRAIPESGESGESGTLGRLESVALSDSEPVVAPMIGARVSEGGTDVRSVALRWQVRSEGGEWTDVGVQRIRLYTMPRPPQSPWHGQALADRSIETPYSVWTDVLEWSCRWARGATYADEAAARITRAVYEHGREGTPGRIHYGDDGRKYGSVAGLDPGRNEITVESFFATAFLRRLAGGESRGGTMNCFDCAGAVTTFASAVGCPVRKVSFSRLDESAFRLHPMRILGEIASDDPKIGGFFHGHVVAWTGPLDERGRVYDACTGFAHESAPDGKGGFAPATGLPWGEAGEAGSYRVRLSPDEAELRLNREYRPLLLVPPRLVFESDPG